MVLRVLKRDLGGEGLMGINLSTRRALFAALPVMFFIAPLATRAGAAGSELTTTKDYWWAKGQCKPSCYQAEAPQASTEGPAKICGYQEYTLTSHALGRGRWSPARSEGTPLPNVVPVPDCKFPTQPKGPWSSVVVQARSSFPGMKKGDTLVVPSGSKWDLDRDDRLILFRTVTVRLYANDWELRPNECGTTDDKITCEARHSVTAANFNEAHFFLDQARAKSTANDASMCRAAAWHSLAIIRGLPRFRTQKTEAGTWKTGLKYKTRFDGLLTEDEVFTKLAAWEKDGVALFKKCGGGEPDTKQYELDIL
jgi:hypothetical protein